MTGVERIAAVLSAVRHVHENKIPGDYVECGVWRGGSSMAAALMWMELGDTSRHFHLYDTYEGMPPPTAADRDISDMPADQLLQKDIPGTGIWCHAGLDEVRKNMLSTGYPPTHLHFHVGAVEHTLPALAPASIAMVRLDTDWYESTRHELFHLYPRLSPHGRRAAKASATGAGLRIEGWN
jgi:O-methyltransferase